VQALIEGARQIMKDKLRSWQSALDAPEKTYVSIVDVVPPTSPAPARGRAMKLGMLAFFLTFGLTLGIVSFFDRFTTRRRSRAAAAKVSAAPRPLDDLDPEDRPDEARPERERERRTSPAPVLVPDDEETQPAYAPAASFKKIRSRSR
jgi:hypothetical protein